MKTVYLFFILTATVTAIGETKREKTPSPPEIYQAFLIAMVNGDTATMERLTISNKDLAILTSNPTPIEHRKKAIAHIKATPYRVLKIGENFRLRDGRVVGSTKEFEKNGWVFIANDVDPVPHMLQKVGDDWKVDAGDLIAARKAVAKKKESKVKSLR